MSELKACPFCGGEAELDAINGVTGAQHFVSCKMTECPGYHHDSYTTRARKTEAIAAWNQRADDWQPIATAPQNRIVEVYAPSPDPERWHEVVHDLPPMICLTQWHPDAGFCVCTIREVTHWREHTPPTPKDTLK